MIQRRARLRTYTPLRRWKPMARSAVGRKRSSGRAVMTELDGNDRECADREYADPQRLGPPEYTEPKYLVFLRGEPCRVPGCRRRSEAHHLRHDEHGRALGRNIKNDQRSISLCHHHHINWLHSMPWRLRELVGMDLREWQDRELAIQRAKWARVQALQALQEAQEQRGGAHVAAESNHAPGPECVVAPPEAERLSPQDESAPENRPAAPAQAAP